MNFLKKDTNNLLVSKIKTAHSRPPLRRTIDESQAAQATHDMALRFTLVGEAAADEVDHRAARPRGLVAQPLEQLSQLRVLLFCPGGRSVEMFEK